jgi:hypothetical protein
LSIDSLIVGIIKNGEKAKLAILKELTMSDADWFDLSENVRRKYYSKDFVVIHFVNVLENQRLVEKRGQRFHLQNKDAVSRILVANKDDVNRVLSQEFGKGDFSGQLDEQEKYVLQKILLFGNSVPCEEVHMAFSVDMDSGIGPFSGYSNAYGRERIDTITQNLLQRNFLRVENDCMFVPKPILTDFLLMNLSEVLLAIKQTTKQADKLVAENTQLTVRADKLDPSQLLKTVSNVQSEIMEYQERAVKHFKEKKFVEAANDCYVIAERLVKSLFGYLYPSKASEIASEKGKLEKIWKDENKEKLYPGVRALASLLYVVLWYKDRTSSRMESESAEDAARTCMFSVLQALKEFDRLKITIYGPVTAFPSD